MTISGDKFLGSGMASSNNDGPIEPEAEPWRITQNDHLEQDLLEEDAESQERVDIPVDDVVSDPRLNYF